MLRALLACDVDPGAQGLEGWTPLHAAVTQHRGARDAALLLERGGVDVDATTHRGQTPLMICSRAETAGVLLQFGADTQARDMDGSTPLHIATTNRDLDTIRVLLRAGADPNAQNRLGRTPLHLLPRTEISRALAAALMLVEHGASLSLPDIDGRSPRELIARGPRTRVWLSQLDRVADLYQRRANADVAT
ncbi:hypothetical protein PINS_up007686 [Pythium insidiosum]|nr:hypothetical protein PINS_up007686 [Pythium insidiosum]